ncbi:MAG TPA: DUF3999 domain-containing protein [Burkholderiales bacterium]|nr:DUF3999 domain-containing protein [Burkholderiales bacterium]
MKVSVFIGIFLATAFAHGAEKPADYAYGLKIDAAGDAALYDMAVPLAVYQGVTRRDLSDVRVFNGAGEVVPYAWRPRRTEKAEAGASVPLTLFSLKGAAGASIDGLSIKVQRSASGAVSVDVKSAGMPSAALETVGYLVDTSAQDRALRSIELDWKASAGFAGKLRIDASDDLANWRTLVTDAALLNLEVGGQRLQQRRIELPQQKAKYLRLAWVNDASKSAPPELTSANGELAQKFIEAPREWAKFSANKGDKENEYVFDFKGKIPADRLRMELPEPNTIVHLEILARDKTEQPWRSVARGVAYRLNQAGGEVVSPDIAVGASSERWRMIRVDQRGGGLGNGAPVLHVGWVPHQLVFAARGTPPFTLAYGNRGAQPAALLIESLIPGYRDDAGATVSVAKTGAQPVVNVQTAQAQPQKELGGETRLQPQVDWKRWSLWGVLGLGVLMLGLMAWRLIKQLGAASPTDDKRGPV